MTGVSATTYRRLAAQLLERAEHAPADQAEEFRLRAMVWLRLAEARLPDGRRGNHFPALSVKRRALKK